MNDTVDIFRNIKKNNTLILNKKTYINYSKKKKYIFSNQKKMSIPLQHDLRLEIVTTEKDLHRFYNIPWSIYANDKKWIAPLWIETKEFFGLKNPFWNHADARLFILYKNKKIVGRVAAIIDHLYCKENNNKIGFFGFFECLDKFQYAEALLQSAQNWLESQGMDVMQGPIDGRIDNGCGFLYEGYNVIPSLLSSYSPAYYLSFAEKFNLTKSRDQIVYAIDLTKPFPEKLKEKANQCIESGVTIRPFNRLRTNKEMKWWIDLFLDTFKDHWGFVPVSKEEVKSRFGVKQLRWIVDPKLFLIAEINDSPIAYIWCTPDYNQIFKDMNGKLNSIQMMKFLLKRKQIKKGIMHFIGIQKDVRNKNIGCCLNYLTLVEMKKRGYTSAEVGWIDEKNNVAHQTIAITGATVYKKYRVFEKNIKNN